MILRVDVQALVPPKVAERLPKPVATEPVDISVAAPAPVALPPAAPAPVAALPPALAPAPAAMDPEPAKRSLADEGGDKFVGFIHDLRVRGLDVVFVLDSTSSMVDVIGQVKHNVQRMVAVLHALVPECRLGVVAYRDRGSVYVTKRLDLTADRDAVLLFVAAISTGIGRNAWNVEDWPEAVHQALADATENLWRARARRAVILIGDAPPPEDEREAALALARDFRDGQKGVIHTIYVRTVSAENMKADPKAGAGRPAAADRALHYSADIQQYFHKLALAGGGEALHLTADDEVVRHLVTLAFGVEWTGNIEQIYQRAGVK